MLDLTLGTDGGGAEEDEATWALDVLDNIRHGARFSFIPLMMGPEYKARTVAFLPHVDARDPHCCFCFTIALVLSRRHSSKCNISPIADVESLIGKIAGAVGDDQSRVAEVAAAFQVDL